MQHVPQVKKGPGRPRITTNAWRKLQKRYTVLDQIGRGGFSTVYKAIDTQEGNRVVAIKAARIRPDMTREEREQALALYDAEMAMLKKLHHPCLPEIYEYRTDEDEAYIIMSYIEGQSLQSYLEEQEENSVPLQEAIRYGIEICDILIFLHEQNPPIIFRDIKPQNIIRRMDGSLALVDFGIARYFKPGKAQDTLLFGSQGYAPPELYGNGQSSVRTDIYALGASLYRMITGKEPGVFDPFDQSIPEAFQKLVDRCLEPRPELRPRSVREVKSQLEEMEQIPTGIRVFLLSPLYSGLEDEEGVMLFSRMIANNPQFSLRSTPDKNIDKTSPAAFILDVCDAMATSDVAVGIVSRKMLEQDDLSLLLQMLIANSLNPTLSFPLVLFYEHGMNLPEEAKKIVSGYDIEDVWQNMNVADIIKDAAP